MAGVCEPRAKVVAPARQQRPDDDAVARVHPGKPARPRAAREAQEDRLRLIVARMAEGDEIRARASPCAIEEGIARRARRVLDRAPFLNRARADRLAIDEKPTAERLRQAADELLVGVGCRAQLMIEMREGDQLQLAFGVELMQDMRERDRIRSARDRRDHAIARANQIVLTNELADNGQQTH